MSHSDETRYSAVAITALAVAVELGLDLARERASLAWMAGFRARMEREFKNRPPPDGLSLAEEASFYDASLAAFDLIVATIYENASIDGAGPESEGNTPDPIK